MAEEKKKRSFADFDKDVQGDDSKQQNTADDD
jgi:hypothetical protein